MSTPAFVTYQMHQDEFFFLGLENTLSENADFGHFWDNFSKLGGSDKINPYAIDTKPINIGKDKEAHLTKSKRIIRIRLMVPGMSFGCQLRKHEYKLIIILN
ncbi:MAG: hypothetical protein FWH12_09155 [Treponema sp.]|nr:hypothetical protein [Treponema sp.]